MEISKYKVEAVIGLIEHYEEKCRELRERGNNYETAPELKIWDAYIDGLSGALEMLGIER